MTAAVYARLEATANRLISKYGKQAKLWRTLSTGPAHNPTTEEQYYLITVVETGYSLANRNETLVQAGDKLGIISTSGKAPQRSDQIEIDGEKYSFVDLEPLNPGGVTLLYEYHARA